MTKDIQRAILRACARFIGKKIDPITKEVGELRTQIAGTFTKAQIDELKQAWDEKFCKPESWINKELLPPGPPGEPGKDAEPVAVADVVAELLATEAMATLVDLQVAEGIAKYFEANPVQHGRDGAKGDPGERGEAGVKGEAGADGVGLAGAMIDRDGNLVVTKTNGEAIALGCVVGKDGASGRDGKDGADFSDVELDYDGERGLIIRGKGGQIVKRLPIPIDRGFWREDKKVEQGDVLTHDGNVWIALKDTSAKPCRENSDDWRLMVRRGRDGLQGPPGKAYEPPQPIKLAGSQ